MKGRKTQNSRKWKLLKEFQMRLEKTIFEKRKTQKAGGLKGKLLENVIHVFTFILKY